MTWTFFALALLSALNPKLLGADLLLNEYSQPRLMFACFLLGGIGTALAIGPAGRVHRPGRYHPDPGLRQRGPDLAVGVPLVAVGVLVATGRLHGRRTAPVPVGAGQPPSVARVLPAAGVLPVAGVRDRRRPHEVVEGLGKATDGAGGTRCPGPHRRAEDYGWPLTLVRSADRFQPKRPPVKLQLS